MCSATHNWGCPQQVELARQGGCECRQPSGVWGLLFTTLPFVPLSRIELYSLPANLHVEVLTPRTLECVLLWR